MEDELLNCQFNTISTNCRQNGASDELRIFGHVQAEVRSCEDEVTRICPALAPRIKNILY